LSPQSDPPKKPPLGLLPPTWFLLSIGLMALLWWLAPAMVHVAWPWTACGALPIAVGVGLAVVADQQFKRHGTTVMPFQESSALVTGGAFAFSRHPMYLGMAVALLGIAIALGVLTPFVVPVGFAVFVHVAFVRHEERDMAAQFGKEYLDYRKRVRCWL